MIINEDTGEILEWDYEKVPYEPTHEYPKTLFLEHVRSVDDMEDFMRVMVDKRKIRRSNRDDLLDFFESCLGYKALNHNLLGSTEGMTVPQYRVLEKLGKLVEFRNVIMVTRKELCSTLGCKDNNLMKKLKSVEGYIRVYTQDDGIRKGEIKILINPKFFYRYWYNMYDLKRDQDIQDWYDTRLMDQSRLR